MSIHYHLVECHLYEKKKLYENKKKKIKSKNKKELPHNQMYSPSPNVLSFGTPRLTKCTPHYVLPHMYSH